MVRCYNQETFLAKCRLVHGTTYGYAKVKYVDSKTYVTITCPLHGDFEQTPANHAFGKGCPGCKAVKTSSRCRDSVESFVEKARAVHGDRYDYSQVEYLGRRVKVLIGCSIHGPFNQTPDNHLNGYGCTGCSDYGYSYTAPASLYVMACDNILKVGITNRDVLTRRQELRKASGRRFDVVSMHQFTTGRAAFDVEQAVLGRLRQAAKPLQESFTGSTECFTGIDKDDLLCIIDEELSTLVM